MSGEPHLLIASPLLFSYPSVATNEAKKLSFYVPPNTPKRLLLGGRCT